MVFHCTKYKTDSCVRGFHIYQDVNQERADLWKRGSLPKCDPLSKNPPLAHFLLFQEIPVWNIPSRKTGCCMNWTVCSLRINIPTNALAFIHVQFLAYTCSYVIWVFKPGVHRPKAGARLVSWYCFCPRSWCVCVSAPEAINYIHVILNRAATNIRFIRIFVRD